MRAGHAALPFHRTEDGARAAIWLTPRASEDRIDGIRLDADGAHVLRVSVTAAPEKGKANVALLALLAREWQFPKSWLSIGRGATGRHKIVYVNGDPRLVMYQLRAWAKQSGPNGEG